MAQRLRTDLEQRISYPWDDWTDGDSWQARAGIDFGATPANFRNHIYTKASDLGMKATVRIKGDLVSFRFFR